MKTTTDLLAGRCRTRLGAGIAAILALAPASVLAGDIFVQSCDDSVPGSLRQAVAMANSGDTVKLTLLPDLCGSIVTLTDGAIAVTQTNLAIEGPADRVNVVGNLSDRIFTHSGSGTFKVTNVNVGLGYLTANNDSVLEGGCIRSPGTVYLLDSSVMFCGLKSQGGARGGAVFAANLTMRRSAIISSKAIGVDVLAQGGGAYVDGGLLVAKYSTIADNYARTQGGGVQVRGNAVITQSTISGNEAGYAGGGVLIRGAAGGDLLRLAQSTVSGNKAQYVAGIFSSVDGYLQNSTIAFNHAAKGKPDLNPGYLAPGLHFSSYANSIVLQSTLLSNNTYTGGANDFSNQSGVSATGSDNFVGASPYSLPDAGLVFGKCARLGPLRDNGGATQTHALQSGSAAIDAGNNAAKIPLDTKSYSDDQRGAPYGRVSGAKADIGAYEVDHGEIVFNGGFDC